MESQVLSLKKPLTYTAQPKSLYLLFFTELWERFGFYTLQTIIILYMTKALMLSDTNANLLYAAFSALLYLTPIAGGYLADQYLGFQRAIILGGFLFIIAYLFCAASQTYFFFIGLSLLICANGFFKPSVSSIVGDLYTSNDPRREGGFTLFYMGINIGALIPPIIAGGLVVKYGWNAGFWLAAFGMAIGQIIFIFGRKSLGDAGQPNELATSDKTLKHFIFITLGILGIVGLCQIAFIYPNITNYCVEASGIFVLLFVGLIAAKEPKHNRNKIIAALVLIIISVAFWSLYNQAFTSLMLFADRNMQKEFLGLHFDAEATQFFNPFFIITISPVLSRLWLKLDGFGVNPATQFKFVLGMIFLTAGFLILALGTKFFAINAMLSPWWLLTSYLLQTIAELLISPIGLAMITILCPKHLVGTMMGVWFFAQAISFAVGAYLANLAAVNINLDAANSIAIYSHAFSIYSFFAFIMVILSLCCIPFINRMVRSPNNKNST